MRRRLILILLALLALSSVIVGVVLASSGYPNHGLSKQKVAELAEHSLTPSQYLKVKRDGEAFEAANRNGREAVPPTPPDVAAPRLIKEVHKEELLAWKQLYAARLHEEVTESWTVRVLSETQTIASLELLTAAHHHKLLPGPAEWRIRFALTRPPTPAEERILHQPHLGIEGLTKAARMLEHLPAPRAGLQLPVELYATEDLGPGLDKIFVDTPSPEAYKPWLIMRNGSRDEALQRGRSLAKNITHKIQELMLSKHVEVFLEPVASGEGGKASHRRHSSIYELIRLFKRGPVPMLLRWKTGAQTGSSLLRRPVQQIVLLP